MDPNSDFNTFMQYIIDDIQSGNGYHKVISADNLIVIAHTRYNNIWGKVDPSNAKIMALTTSLEEMKKATPVGPGTLVNATDASGKNKFAPLEEWRKKCD